jgi:hypothetical protein
MIFDNPLFIVYVDMGALRTDTATLSFAFDGISSTRAWDIKVTQIKCNAETA